MAQLLLLIIAWYLLDAFYTFYKTSYFREIKNAEWIDLH